MADVVLFHHVQGLTPGVQAFADELRAAGHAVHTPDLFEGRTFVTLEEGMGHAREVGFGELSSRGDAAQQLAQTRSNAQGALLIDACVPISEFGAEWPTGVPVQVHGMDADPFFAEEGGDIDAARELVAGTDQAELFLYPGDRHLFADSSLPSYDETAAALLLERVLGFLQRL